MVSCGEGLVGLDIAFGFRRGFSAVGFMLWALAVLIVFWGDGRGRCDIVNGFI